MNINLIPLYLLILTFLACGSSQNNSSKVNSTMEFTVTKIRSEKDGETLFLNDHKGVPFTTIISIPNGNYIALNEGDKISLKAVAIMESHPAQIISTDVKLIEKGTQLKTMISTDKNTYNVGDPIVLTF